MSSIKFEDSIPTTILLEELDEKTIFERVSVNIKVIKKMESEIVLTGKKKQDVIVGNSSATGKVTLWENNIDSLQEQASYTLENFVVCEYNNYYCSKYLGMGLQGSQIIPIGDIGNVKQAEEATTSSEILNAVIIGVSHLSNHKLCLRCNAQVEPSTSSMGRCTKPECAMLQRYYICSNQVSAKLSFMVSSKIHSLNAYGQVVKDLAEVSGDTEVTEEGLMKLPQLSIVAYNENNVITSFTK